MIESRNFEPVKDTLAIIGLIVISYVLIPENSIEGLSLLTRRLDGALGIVIMPFLHGSISHLVGNVIPLTIMSLLLSSINKRPLLILSLISLSGGLLLWAIGRPYTYHYGASVMLYGLAAYLIAGGMLARQTKHVLVCLFVCVTYGLTILQGIIPNNYGTSWDGHLCGFFAGLAVAFYEFGKDGRP